MENFICLVEGYYRIFVNDDATLYPKQSSQNDEADDDRRCYISADHAALFYNDVYIYFYNKAI